MQYHALSVGAILQISYIIPTIGYIYSRTYERMRERDKNYLTSLLLIICANLCVDYERKRVARVTRVVYARCSR